MFSCEFFEFFKNTFFTEHLRATASEPWVNGKGDKAFSNEQVMNITWYQLLTDFNLQLPYYTNQIIYFGKYSIVFPHVISYQERIKYCFNFLIQPTVD